MALGEKMNFKDMSKEQLVNLLTNIRHSLFECYDAQDTVLDISDKLSVNQSAGFLNELEDD